jgi:uncharacterized protein YqgV (UPF0045/DUF77 family)
MKPKEKTAFVIKWQNLEKGSGDFDFSDVVDKACEELKDRQIKHSIQRIKNMMETLSVLEGELDAFLKAGNRK